MQRRPAALDPATAAFVEGGCGMVVAAVSPDGTPCVARGWGLAVLDHERALIRLLVPSDDTTLVEHLGEGGRLAVTAGNLRTYRAIQLKGQSLGIEEATEADLALGQRYIDAFFADMLAVNGVVRNLCERFVPVGLAACTAEIEELYDQTPGPGAGVALVTGA